MTAPAPAMRGVLRALFDDVLADLEPSQLVARALHCTADRLLAGHDAMLPLPARGRPARGRPVHVVAAGKAAPAMARGLAALVEPQGRDLAGLVVAPSGLGDPPPRGLRLIEGGHPLPDAGSLAAAGAARDALARLDRDDAVVCLLSGGGSALLEAPLDPRIPLAALRDWHRLLVDSGAAIGTVNALRKRVSAVKGGRLAALAAATPMLTLILSDVAPEHPADVASGPTLPDPTTHDEARAAFAALGLAGRAPAAIAALLARDDLPETRKPGDPCFAAKRHAVLADCRTLRDTAVRHATRRGWRVQGVDVADDLDSAALADRLLAELSALAARHPGETVAIASAGESSVALPAAAAVGRGGRNQSFVLACVDRIAGQPVAVLGAGSDGVDGSAPAAGAVADGSTAARAAAAGLDVADHARRFDAHALFAALDDTVVTGPTGNNLRDLRLLVRTR